MTRKSITHFILSSEGREQESYTLISKCSYLVSKNLIDYQARSEAETDYRNALERGQGVTFMKTRDFKLAQRYQATGVPEF